ncbi:MAG: ABC transporter ATP-binding protein/permease [Oscillospiraceae bacterium]|nr:ABC transporter ATP-binding protein/permease [Oscillospiraceae bacterium]
MPGHGDRGGKGRPRDAKGALRRILRYLMEYRWWVILFLFCTLLSNIGNLLGPRFAGKAIGVVEAGCKLGPGHVDMGTVGRYALLMLVCYVGGSLMSFLVNIGMMRVGRRVARNMRRDVFNKLMTLPVGYFDRHQAGDIISRVSYDVDVVCTSLSTDVIQVVTSTVTVAGSFIMMCTISLPLVVCMAATIPASILFTRHMGKKTRPLYARRSAAYGAMNGFAEEMFAGQRTILAYAQEDRVCDDFSRINRAAAGAYRDADGLGMKMGPTIGMISNFGLAAIGTGGSILYMLGVVGLEQISSFVLYSRKFSGPINEISNIVNEIFSALAASERVFRLLDEQSEIADIYGAAELTSCRGGVRAEDVSFGYDPDRTVLHHLDFEAKPGQTVAIVGPTGAGKTTIINLLMRFYDPDKGCIYVDGTENRAYTMDSLRRSYAMVLQDTWVFRGTIFENIAYGKEDATMEEVVRAAKAARIHSYIMRLPQGYNTVIITFEKKAGKNEASMIE